MKIKTSDGNIYDFNECEIIEENENQKELAEELFQNAGILIADMKGGEQIG